MKGCGTKLGRRKERAIEALLTCDTLSQAARTVGIGDVTLWRWLQEPGFKKAFREAKRRVLDEALTSLQKSTGKAISTLLAIMEDKDKPASARVTAARAILETAFKVIRVEDLEARVQEMEQRLA
jgi:hypothetical protein